MTTDPTPPDNVSRADVIAVINDTPHTPKSILRRKVIALPAQPTATDVARKALERVREQLERVAFSADLGSFGLHRCIASVMVADIIRFELAALREPT